MPTPEQPRNMASNMSWKYFFIFWGCWLLFMTGYFYFTNVGRYRESVKLKAVVIDVLQGYEEGRWGNGHPYEYPQFNYWYKDSMYTSYDMNVHVSAKVIGDTMTVIVHPSEPGEGRIYKLLLYWVSFYTLLYSIIVGAFIFAIPLVIQQIVLYKKEYGRK
ncbi:MAG TPA: DUF3592 domain-containing protein [Chitinophagaceae bacterium]|jgi:hypothetical protein|nr:DUF3592 domain-containing protein [Chitinophagaceae bacterium]